MAAEEGSDLQLIAPARSRKRLARLERTLWSKTGLRFVSLSGVLTLLLLPISIKGGLEEYESVQAAKDDKRVRTIEL